MNYNICTPIINNNLQDLILTFYCIFVSIKYMFIKVLVSPMCGALDVVLQEHVDTHTYLKKRRRKVINNEV